MGHWHILVILILITRSYIFYPVSSNKSTLVRFLPVSKWVYRHYLSDTINNVSRLFLGMYFKNVCISLICQDWHKGHVSGRLPAVWKLNRGTQRFFRILTIYNAGTEFVVVFWHNKLDSAAEKTHPQVTTHQQTWKCRNYYTHKFLSKTFHFVQNSKNGSVLLRPVLAGKYHEKCNLRQRSPTLNFRHPLEAKGPVSELILSEF